MLPSWVLWLSPVVVLPMLAVLWTTWVARPRGPLDPHVTVREHDRFREAMQAPLPRLPSGSRRTRR